jgi:ATP-binding cassette subfamily B protein
MQGMKVGLREKASMKQRSSYWKLSPYLRRELPLFIRGWACILGYLAVTLTLPYLAGQVAGSMGEGNVEQIAYWLGLGTLAFLLRSIFQYGENIWTIAASLKVVLYLRQSVYAHLQSLGLDYFEQAQTGDLTYRLTEEIDRIGEVVNKLSQQFLSCVLQLIAIPIYMLFLNWQLTLASVILAPLMAWLVGQFGQQLLVLSRRSQSQVSNLAALLTEVFGSIRVVQAFAAQAYEVERFTETAEANRQAKFRAERVKAVQYPVVGFLEAVSIMSLFLVGGWQISLNNLTSAEFVSYLAAVALLLHPIELVTNQYNEFKQTEASIERVFQLMAIQPTVKEKPNAIVLPPTTGKIEYRHIYFAYQSDRPVLQDFSLTVQPGEVMALVGPSGAGKTTIANLLPRFYDPSSGEILIDGFDLREVTLTSLRRQIGIVPQETALFSGTIAQNIAYGQHSLDFPAIEAAAKIANAHNFITQLSQGYYTWVEERGSNLSGGQRQRLAIARAILLDPRILILDEATSALDSESESYVQEALERAMENRTTIIIAHRLSTVYRANRILFLEKGEIIESGTHAELLAKGGRYASFYTVQVKGA